MTDRDDALTMRTCIRCDATATQVKLGPLISDPEGWTYVTVGGLPVCNATVCPACARNIRRYLLTSPTELERQQDASREAAFTRGYDMGSADAPTGEAVA